MSAAGRIRSVDATGAITTASRCSVEYGKRQPDGTVQAQGTYLPRDIGPSPSWRNLRVPFDELAPTPTPSGSSPTIPSSPATSGWRSPRRGCRSSRPSTRTIGTEQPVLLDWAVGLQFPCQRPFDHQNGVAEMPNYRILPDRPLAVSSTDTWQSAENGGPLGFTEILAGATTIPTYLKDDWGRDWGSLGALRPVLPERGSGRGGDRYRNPLGHVDARRDASALACATYSGDCSGATYGDGRDRSDNDDAPE